MMKRAVLLLLSVGTFSFVVGCVDRRFVVESNVPGAQIFWDGQPLGPAPVDSRWEYAGEYTVSALAPGYEPYRERVRLKPKWYMYPPFDIVAELLYPGRIEDVRRIQVTMQPKQPKTDDELIQAAELLRSEGQALPPSRIPDERASGAGQVSPPVVPLDVGNQPGRAPGAVPLPGVYSPDARPAELPPGYVSPIVPIPIGPTR